MTGVIKRYWERNNLIISVNNRPSPLVLICNVQGGYTQIPADNVWHNISLPISTQRLLCSVSSPWYGAILCMRTHDGIVDARYSAQTTLTQTFSYVTFCIA